MANVKETANWETGIYQLETSDPVLGGENGIDNLQARQLANRTQWLKKELAAAVTSISSNKSAVDAALDTKADKATAITAGNGLTGGGTLAANRTLALGTPGQITATSTNSVAATSHTHAIDSATTARAGVVQLNDTLTSTATNQALTAAQGKVLADMLGGLDSAAFRLRGSLGSKNLDDIKGEANYGVHHMSTNVGAKADLNYPVTQAGSLFVLPAAYAGVQVYIPYAHTDIHLRNTNQDGSWSTWRKIGGDKVGLSGNETISNTKTFAHTTFFAGGLRISTSGRSDWAQLGVGSNEVYLTNPASSKYLQLKDDNTLQYGSRRIIIDGDNAIYTTTTADSSNIVTVDANGLLKRLVQPTTLAGYGIADGVTQAQLTAAINNLVNGAPGALDTLKELAAALGNDANYAATTAARITQAAPSGSIGWLAGSTAPAGWLKANGAAVSRTTYAALYAAIGTRYGAGDGSTTFNVPDLRGEFVRGWDDGRGIDASRGLGSYQADALQDHTHITKKLAQQNNSGTNIARGAGYEWETETLGIQTTGARVANETRPRNIALMACIKI